MEKQSIQNQPKPFSCFLNSPRFLGGFLSKTMFDHHHEEILINPPSPPTPILEDLFKPSSMEIYEQKGIGVALEEDDDDQDLDSCTSKPNNRKMVLFGANLKKVQVQEQPPHVVEQSQSDLKSPSDYGIKTKNLQLILHSDVKSDCLREIGKLSLREMELSEEYTCVMKHGNDPKIIHIFDDIIVETCLKKQPDYDEKGINNGNSVPFVDFLGFCCNCKVKLGDDKDIYMYRGEKSFCSPECRFQEMIMEGDEEKEFQIF